MCLDDGRVVSNFVAQVKPSITLDVVLLLVPYYLIIIVASILFVTCFRFNSPQPFMKLHAGTEEGPVNGLWRWKTNKKLPICFRLGNFFLCFLLSLTKPPGDFWHALSN